jgi:hypothetical protein
MYKPFGDTVLKYLQKIISEYTEVEYYTNVIDYNIMEPNEVLIFIGCAEIPDFQYLKQKGIYTIYYNTEPNLDLFDSDEIWVYSRYAFEKYEKRNENQCIKYLPIFLEEDIPSVPYLLNINTNTIPFVFMGNFMSRQDKLHILMQSELLRNRIQQVYHLWNDNDYNQFISSYPNIYLNIMKTDTNFLPTARIHKLLSHKCIIISEYSNELEDEIYKEMVYFCKLEEMENVFKTLINKTNIELQEDSENKYRIFKNNFSTENAIQRIMQK